MLKIFLAAALAVGAGGLTYAAAEVATAPEVTETDYDAEDGISTDDGKGGKGKGDFKGKGGKKGGKKAGKGKGGKGGFGKGGPKGGKGPKGPGNGEE